MALTNFQKQNIDKLIMLNEYEINKRYQKWLKFKKDYSSIKESVDLVAIVY